MRPISSTDLIPAHTTATLVREFLEISRNIKRFFDAPMYAADTAGCKYVYAGHGRNDHRGRDGCCAVFFASNDKWQVAPAALDHITAGFSQLPDFINAEANSEPAIQDCDRSGYGIRFPNRIFDGQRGLDIARVGHAVADDGRLECDHRSSRFECVCNMGCDSEIRLEWLS